jgi:hypothetical protein
LLQSDRLCPYWSCLFRHHIALDIHNSAICNRSRVLTPETWVCIRSVIGLTDLTRNEAY